VVGAADLVVEDLAAAAAVVVLAAGSAAEAASAAAAPVAVGKFRADEIGYGEDSSAASTQWTD
jgi:hypothetical protein